MDVFGQADSGVTLLDSGVTLLYSGAHTPKAGLGLG